jgi:hypothetical protein
MRTTSVAALLGTAALALALALSAEAKAPLTGSVCGSSRCVAFSSPNALWASLIWSEPFSLVSAPRPKTFYRLTFRSSEGFRWVALWPRGARVIRADDRAATPPIYGRAASRPYWRTVSVGVQAVLAQATAGVKPYRASARWRVR